MRLSFLLAVFVMLPGSSVTLASGQSYPYGIAVNGSTVYWINAGNSFTPTGNVMKVIPTCACSSGSASAPP
jgi:hypothetical protein